MKSLWLASTALLITTGIACAQSTQTASPAPTGAVTAPQATSSSTASPGNLAPSPSSAGSTTMSSLPSPGSSVSPAPNGAATAPSTTAGVGPGMSPGKTAPTMASASPGPMPMQHHWSSHHWSSSTMLPQDASATTYLHIAKSAIWHHNVTLADDALSHAETRLLDRSVPQGQIAADDSNSVQSIESARQALRSGNFTAASSDTKQAASAVSGM